MTIAAVSTAPGIGGIAVIRISGPRAIEITDSIFVPIKKGHQLSTRTTHTITFGHILQHDQSPLDQVVVSIYKFPHSFTGEDIVEISCHGSIYIQQSLLKLLISKGCRLAEPGEFTQRAFLNRRMDLSQAEAVADLIAAGNEAAHRIAMDQMKGGFSNKLNELRLQLLNLGSLLELELDFSEEDVEFADRQQLQTIATDLQQTISRLADSFQTGNAIKNGIPIAIIGETNAGKSTLLNQLLGDEKAIVSDIHGTTRDVIEDTIIMNGILLRFIDTAGIRDTSDKIEAIGIERTYKRIEQAQIILWMIDGTRLGDSFLTQDLISDAQEMLTKIQSYIDKKQSLYIVINKVDLITEQALTTNIPLLIKGLNNVIEKNQNSENSISNEDKENTITHNQVITISATNGIGLDQLKEKLHQTITLPNISQGDIIVCNIRHYEALKKAEGAINRIIHHLSIGTSGDLIAEDVKECNHWLGSIIGEISSDEILNSIFSRFCIGK